MSTQAYTHAVLVWRCFRGPSSQVSERVCWRQHPLYLPYTHAVLVWRRFRGPSSQVSERVCWRQHPLHLRTHTLYLSDVASEDRPRKYHTRCTCLTSLQRTVLASIWTCVLTSTSTVPSIHTRCTCLTLLQRTVLASVWNVCVDVNIHCTLRTHTLYLSDVASEDRPRKCLNVCVDVNIHCIFHTHTLYLSDVASEDRPRKYSRHEQNLSHTSHEAQLPQR